MDCNHRETHEVLVSVFKVHCNLMLLNVYLYNGAIVFALWQKTDLLNIENKKSLLKSLNPIHSWVFFLVARKVMGEAGQLPLCLGKARDK